MKIAIVTGASSGLGEEFVKQIAKRYKGIEEIWVLARREERLLELEAKLGKRIIPITTDLSEEKGIVHLKGLLKSKRPDVKILVNSAGFGKIGTFESGSYEDQTGMVRLNCEALVSLTHIVLPFMSKNSRIIQIASSAAFLPQPKFAIYAATKSFVLSFSRALNQELRSRKISVTAVCPGAVKTEFFDIAEQTGKNALLKHLVKADPVKVVRDALMAAECGKTVTVYGVLMKAVRILAKFLPYKWIRVFL